MQHTPVILDDTGVGGSEGLLETREERTLMKFMVVKEELLHILLKRCSMEFKLYRL